MLSTHDQVVWALLTYTDWWQPTTASVYPIKRRGSSASDGIREGLLDTMSGREELCRRMRSIKEQDRRLLYLWYMRQLSAIDIAKDLGISRRQCFRRRSAVIRHIIELGDDVEGRRATA
jgi:DNA-directed RNA polymerase specialized sigma subunit